MATHSSILAWSPHGHRGLAGYSPWGRKELDMTGRLSLTHSSILGASQVAPAVKNPPAKVGDTRDVVSILGWEDRLE